MICQYCQSTCLRDSSYFSNDIAFWNCPKCTPRVNYFHIKDEPLIYTVEIEFYHNEKFIFYKEIRPFTSRSNYPPAGAFYQGIDMLWSVPVPNNITPDTIEEKFTLYATFS